MRNSRLFFYAFFGLWLLLAVLNLDKLPVAWVDETMLIDPAITFLRTGNFASRIWPYPGTEKEFLAYLPLVSIVHILNLSVFPWDMFFIRLPWLLFLITTAFFLYTTIRFKDNLSINAALLLVLIFICDEGISNAMRSGRVEMLNLALMSVVIYLFIRERLPYLQTFFLSLLFLSHPAVWMITGILMLYRLLHGPFKHKLAHLILFSIPVFLFLAFAGFDLPNLYRQFIVHGNEHTPGVVGGNLFYKHFIGFFLPVYRVQPYIILLHAVLLVYSIYRIATIRNFRSCIIEILFVATDLYWLVFLAPFHRYTPPLVFLMFLLLPGFISFIRGKVPAPRWSRAATICLLIYVAFPFLFRNAVAFAQRPERDASRMFEWLDEKTAGEAGKKLFIDASVAHYYSLKRDKVDFTLVYAVKKFKFSDFDAVYYLSLLPEPENAVLLGEYDPPSLPVSWQKLAKVQKIVTYRGLRLYKVNNEEGMKKLQKGYAD